MSLSYTHSMEDAQYVRDYAEYQQMMSYAQDLRDQGLHDQANAMQESAAERVKAGYDAAVIRYNKQQQLVQYAEQQRIADERSRYSVVAPAKSDSNEPAWVRMLRERGWYIGLAAIAIIILSIAFYPRSEPVKKQLYVAQGIQFDYNVATKKKALSVSTDKGNYQLSDKTFSLLRAALLFPLPDVSKAKRDLSQEYGLSIEVPLRCFVQKRELVECEVEVKKKNQQPTDSLLP